MRYFAPIIALFAIMPSPLYAQDMSPKDRDYLFLSTGYYDASDDDKALDLRAEYRPAYDICDLQNFRPFAGLELTHEGSLWLGGGVLYNFELTPDWTLTPSFGAGYYAQGSSDLDLGYPIIFRSQLEASYSYDNDVKLTLSYSHLSNAHLDKHNPGTEVISVGIGYPF